MFGIDQQANITLEHNNLERKLTRALCIHGHFYQPPRENPISGMIPNEEGAAPYPNWNARIHAECYHPNAELGNFERISFNVGPTLFEWMESYDAVTYRRIIAQDHSNVERFGVGNAMAQAYHHTILPLASRADKETQVYWGIADFEHRFGRKPQGMWLPEAAVDLETLEVLADHGIEFTILAPWQAAEEHIDPTEPYWVNLSSGRRIAVFFYHQVLSGGVSFNQQMTTNAHEFALRDVSRYFNKEKRKQDENQLLVVASDGELYGHHQAFRDWFLAYLVNGAGARVGIRLTFPALWLRENPPKREVNIREFTSWSCHHGVDRWSKPCGCAPGDGRWKFYLREAFNRFADEVDQIYVDEARKLGLNPWILRHNYIHVLLGNTTLEAIVNRARDCNPTNEIPCPELDDYPKIELLLEAQRERQRIYTSCGWFFEDFDRIEPQNNVAYAAMAANLVYQATDQDISSRILEDLKFVASDRTGLRGDHVFDRYWRENFQFTELDEF
jgi:hypothetical protein